MATRNPTILDKPEDWSIWIDDIRGSIPAETWSLIDPDLAVHENFMRKPPQPRPQEVNVTKTTYLELTHAEKNVYDQTFKHYQVFLREYENQTKGLQDAKNLIKTRVSDAKSILLKGGDTARDWLTTLKKATSASKGYISYQTAQKYQAAIRRAPTAATINRWLTSWELAMAEALQHDIPEIAAGRWLRDLATAISSISEALAVMLIADSTDDNKTNPDRYLEIGVKIREVVGTMNIPRRKVMRGAVFAADFDGEPAAVEEESRDEGRNIKSRKRAGTTSALRNANWGKKRSDKCKACGQPHDLSRCFYAFPELRYPGFEPNDFLVAKVAQALKERRLATEVEVIRKEAETQ
jgi:hypothetical protein